MIVCYCVCAALAGLYWVVAAAENRRKDETLAGGVEDDVYDAGEPTDLTDFQQPGFKYIT